MLIHVLYQMVNAGSSGVNSAPPSLHAGKALYVFPLNNHQWSFATATSFNGTKPFISQLQAKFY
jgi:hypothetical protein